MVEEIRNIALTKLKLKLSLAITSFQGCKCVVVAWVFQGELRCFQTVKCTYFCGAKQHQHVAMYIYVILRM